MNQHNFMTRYLLVLVMNVGGERSEEYVTFAHRSAVKRTWECFVFIKMKCVKCPL